YVAVATWPRTLADAVLSGYRWTPVVLRAMGVGLADGLVSLHESGAAHGAVRPATTLLDPDSVPLLAGFDMAAPGLAVALVPDGYSAPERLPGWDAPPGPAADVYELAATVYVCSGGCLPWLVGGDAAATDPAGRAVRVVDPPGVSVPFGRALREAL